MIDMLTIILGFLACIAGVFCLWRSWKLPKRSLLFVSLGWVLILVALILWGNAWGSDRGVAIGLVILSFIAGIFILHSAWLSSKKNKNDKPQSKAELSAKKWSGKERLIVIGKILFHGLIMGIFAEFAAMGIYELSLMMGAGEANSLVFALGLFPIIWGSMAAYYFMTPKLKNKILMLVGVTIFGASMMVIGNMG